METQNGSLVERPSSSSLEEQNSPRVERQGSASFRYLKVELAPGQSIVTEPGAMASCDAQVALDTGFNGGFVQGLVARYLGGESFFINTFRNRASRPQQLILTQKTPGEIIEKRLNGEEFFVQAGAFIAHTDGISHSVKWAGFSSFLAGEGLFRLSFKGRGRVWYGCYGAVIEKDVKGELIVDSGHLLSYPPTIQLKIQMSGGIFSSFFSGEGLVLRLTGSGRVQIQTRSVSGLAGWLNPRFWS